MAIEYILWMESNELTSDGEKRFLWARERNILSNYSIFNVNNYILMDEGSFLIQKLEFDFVVGPLWESNDKKSDVIDISQAEDHLSIHLYVEYDEQIYCLVEDGLWNLITDRQDNVGILNDSETNGSQQD